MKPKFSNQFKISRMFFMLSIILLASACSKDNNPISGEDENGDEITEITTTANMHFFDTGEEFDFEGVNHGIDFDGEFGAQAIDEKSMRMQFEDEARDVTLAWLITDDLGISEKVYNVGFSDENNQIRMVTATIHANDLTYSAGIADLNDDGEDTSGTGSIQFTSITDTHVKGTYSFTAYTWVGSGTGAKKVEVINGEFECKILRK